MSRSYEHYEKRSYQGGIESSETISTTDKRSFPDSIYESTPIEKSIEEFVLVSSGLFECPVENDGSLLLSTLQGQIPHANGLHYVATESDRLRAIRFDKRFGKLYPPSDGWGDRVYTVSFANISTYGCLRAPLAADRYDRATRTFRDSVDAVERLFDIAYETDQPSDIKTVDKLKQEMARLRTRNRELDTEKRSLEVELEEKDKKILSLITEVPGPEHHNGDSYFLNQALRMVQDKENDLTRIAVERDQLKNQLKSYEMEQNVEENEKVVYRSDNQAINFGDTPSQESLPTKAESKADKDLQIRATWFQNQWDESKKKIGELETILERRSHALIEAEAAMKSLEQELMTLPITELQQMQAVARPNEASMLDAIKVSELEDRDVTINELQQQLASAHQQIHECKNQLQDANNLRQRLDEELEETRKMYHDTKWRNGELESIVNWKDLELANMGQRINEKETSMTKIIEELDETKKRCQDLETSCQEFRNREVEKKENEDFRWRVHELEANVVVAEHENCDLLQEIQILKEQLLTVDKKLEKTQEPENDTIPEPEESITTSHPFQTTPAYAQMLEEEAKVRHELSSANQKNDKLESELQRLREIENQLNESLLSMGRDLDDSRWRCGELEAMAMGGVVVADAPYDETKKRVSELLQEIAKLQQQHDEAVCRANVAETEMNEAKTEMNKAKKELEKTRKECEKLRIDWEERNEKLRIDLKERNEKWKDTEFKVKELEAALTEVQLHHSEVQLKEEQTFVPNGPVDKAETVSMTSDTATGVTDYRLLGQFDESRDQIALLESQLAHYKHLFHDTGARLTKLQGTLVSAHRHLWDAFIIRKEPFIDRHKWKLSMWYEGSDEYYARVWYELDAPDAKHVYLAASYHNWECLLLMMWHEHGKWGLWVDVPRGRHEFRFVVDGEWKTGDQYLTCSNSLNSQNNWRDV